MKLYDVPRNTWVKSIEPDNTDVFKFHHIDGMYSFCNDKEGNICHYAAWMEVEPIEKPKDAKEFDPNKWAFDNGLESA